MCIYIYIDLFTFNPYLFKPQSVRPKAMSASIGVDFTVQAGLLPQFLEICIGLVCDRINIYMYIHMYIDVYIYLRKPCGSLLESPCETIIRIGFHFPPPPNHRRQQMEVLASFAGCCDHWQLQSQL